MNRKRRGRHAAPGTVRKAAAIAVPAVVAAGTVAVTASHVAAAPPPAPGPVPGSVPATVAAATAAWLFPQWPAAVPAAPPAPARPAGPARTWTVRPGDTLSAIAGKVLGGQSQWPWLWHENKARITDPDVIFPGEHLKVPHVPPGATPPVPPSPAPAPGTRAPAAPPPSQAPAVAYSVPGLRGQLGCSGLKQLWENAGGPPSEAATAASVAMAESGGSQYATNGSSGTRGYWQISPGWGQMSTYDALGNAEAAVKISAGGTNWSPWTTYTSGAYSGRC